MPNFSCRTPFGKSWTLPRLTLRWSVLLSRPYQTFQLNFTSSLCRFQIICISIDFLSYQSRNLSDDKIFWNSWSARTYSLAGKMFVWEAFSVDYSLIKRPFIFWIKLRQKGAIADCKFGIFGHLRIWSTWNQQSRATFYQLHKWKTSPNLSPQNL